MVYKISTLDEMENLAKNIIDELEGEIIFLNGGLGAGKTTFVTFAANVLGFEDNATSPTFSIANRYETRNLPIIHMDLYRLQTEYELEMTGFWELIGENATIFIEWADKFQLQNYITKYIEMEIIVNDKEERVIKITKFGTRK